MAINLGINEVQGSLRKMVKLYLKRAKEIESHLKKKPNEWGKFQSEFNAEVDAIFRSVMNFEKVNMAKGNEEKVYKFKQMFINRFRMLFIRGDYSEWSFRKPYGYAGDFKIIDDIYQNNPKTTGFERLFDNYFQMSAISIAVRNRKEDFKRIIKNLIKNQGRSTVRIMDLASGPCRDVKELLTDEDISNKKVIIDCYENDEHAIAHAKKLLKNFPNVSFIQENAIRIAFKKDIHKMIDKKYDLIFSTGLFDYFNERISIALVKNLKKLLKPKGVMAIANVRDKYSNPSVHFMEWAGDWNLIYRSDEEFKKIFIDAGFKNNEIEVKYEQQGIVISVIAPKQ